MIESYEIPTKLSELSINQFVELNKKVDEVVENPELNLHEHLLSCFIPSDKLRFMKKSEIDRLGKNIYLLLRTGSELQLVTKVGGQELYFHHDLGNDLTAGEYADIASFQERGLYENLHNILAVLYRPAKQVIMGSYELEPYNGIKDRGELILKEMKANVAAGALVFFYNLISNCEKTSQDYSETTTRENR